MGEATSAWTRLTCPLVLKKFGLLPGRNISPDSNYLLLINKGKRFRFRRLFWKPEVPSDSEEINKVSLEGLKGGQLLFSTPVIGIRNVTHAVFSL